MKYQSAVQGVGDATGESQHWRLDARFGPQMRELAHVFGWVNLARSERELLRGSQHSIFHLTLIIWCVVCDLCSSWNQEICGTNTWSRRKPFRIQIPFKCTTEFLVDKQEPWARRGRRLGFDRPALRPTGRSWGCRSACHRRARQRWSHSPGMRPERMGRQSALAFRSEFTSLKGPLGGSYLLQGLLLKEMVDLFRCRFHTFSHWYFVFLP